MRHGMHDYPDTPLLDPTMKFKRATMEALVRFKASEPWLWAPGGRTHKFNVLLKELRAIYGKPHVRASYRHIKHPFSDSGGSSYNQLTEYITMRGRFSVVTFLHEFAHALGKNEYGATRWSANLFAQTFPEKMGALTTRRHMLVARDYLCDGCIDRRDGRTMGWTNVECLPCRRNPRYADRMQRAEPQLPGRDYDDRNDMENPEA